MLQNESSEEVFDELLLFMTELYEIFVFLSTRIITTHHFRFLLNFGKTVAFSEKFIVSIHLRIFQYIFSSIHCSNFSELEIQFKVISVANDREILQQTLLLELNQSMVSQRVYEKPSFAVKHLQCPFELLE